MDEVLLQDGYDLFRGFVENQAFRKVAVNKGEYIIKQHQMVKDVYWASPAKFTIRHTAENGKILSLGDYSLADNLFGEVEYFSQKLSSFDMIAADKLELLVIPTEHLRDFLLRESKAAFWLNHRIVTIQQFTMHIALERALYPLKFNIIKDLIQRHTSQTPWINHAYMYQEAERFGCTERAYARVIRELIDNGAIIRQGDKSTLIPVDIERLKAILTTYQE
ncbi:N-ribosylnicotinamide CRP regulator [Vibrio alfacsensis]|uniref:Crp/Fnr family transcriptional regulator n=1 Tax=Vibrio alfacsensis TaxID=1074311 RepID=UPI001BF0A54A|nr:cyclic nucleotide-binding domain-containing protein [Vibrio alfacsensis]BBM64768.1 N-ribosylnicotinamide CRP regulator [Vibrio alfacsensis]